VQNVLGLVSTLAHAALAPTWLAAVRWRALRPVRLFEAIHASARSGSAEAPPGPAIAGPYQQLIPARCKP